MHRLSTRAKFHFRLFREMLRIRTCEESLVDPIQQGDIKTPCHLCSGQEAVAVGICAALRPTDVIFGGHRSHGHYLAKGGDMKALVAEIFARSGGCSRGRGGSMHLIAPDKGVWGVVPIVAGTISLATGSAMAARVANESRVTVSFFGDGATGEGSLYESMNLAALLKLPIVYVCENNLYSTHMPIRECRPNNKIYLSGLPFGIKGYRVDGNDVLSVYRAAKSAIERSRARKGPGFIECLTYRLRGHVGADDNIQGSHVDIRPATEVQRWRRLDPLVRLRRILSKEGIQETDFKDLSAEVLDEVAEAHRYARSSPAPDPEALKHHVFSEKVYVCPR